MLRVALLIAGSGKREGTGENAMKSRYLNLIPLEDARRLLFEVAGPLKGTLYIPVEGASGWITAKPLFTAFCMPLTDVASMDGYAVRVPETSGASEQCPIEVHDFLKINTGGIVPEGYDAVIMAEDCWTDKNRLVIRKTAYPGQNIRRAGEDVREGQMVIPAGHLVRPVEVGALASYGVNQVSARACSVGIIPTGEEVIEPGTVPTAGQVIDGNTRMTMAWLDIKGVSCTRYPICTGDADSLKEMVARAVRFHDLVIISAGSSTGTRDFTASVVAELGTLVFHGVAIKPGKPVLAGRISDTVIIGLPGYPLSAQVVLREILIPLLRHWGFFIPPSPAIRATLSRSVVSDPGIQEFIPVTTAEIGGRLVAVPQPGGFASHMASIRSNGYIIVPPETEGFEAESIVTVHMITDVSDTSQTILIGGPLTPVMDLVLSSHQVNGIKLVPVRSDANGAIASLFRGSSHAALLNESNQAARSETRLNKVMICRIPYGLAFRKDAQDPRLAPGEVAVTSTGDARMIFEQYLESQPGNQKSWKCIQFKDEGAIATAIASGLYPAGTLSRPAALSHGLSFAPLGDIVTFLYTLPGGDARLNTLLRFLVSDSWKSACLSAGYETT